MKAVLEFTEKEKTIIKVGTELHNAILNVDKMHNIYNIDPTEVNILNWVNALKELRNKYRDIDDIELIIFKEEV